MATKVERAAKLSRDRSVASLRIRERSEELENTTLAPYATRSAEGRRARPDEPSPTRMSFAVDRDRIIHSKAFRRPKHKTQRFLAPAAWGEPETPEGWVVRYADKIAYLHHDIDDAMRAGIITEADLPADLRTALGSDRAERLDTMIYDVIVASYGKADVTMSPEVL